MSPVPSLGQISFTKFTSPDKTTNVLGQVVPGQTTATDVQASLAAAGQPDPLWNDLLAYDPPLSTASIKPGQQVAVDNELLRACRAQRADRFLLLWVALNLADPRLDAIVREVLTDSAGHLVPDMVNATRLEAELTTRASVQTGAPHDKKVTTNILSLLETCRLINPTKYGGSIVGIDAPLPTAHAVPATAQLISERLGDRGFYALPDREVDLAVSIGANAWLNLSPAEFRKAARTTPQPAQQSQRGTVPVELVELATQLRRKGQVVLQGPPGAGKTYVALKYVGWATAGRAEDSRLQAIVSDLPLNQRTVAGIADEVIHRGLAAVWDIVQFHPGYDYTDFVRALVAKPHAQGVTFVAEHRILSLISALGRELERRSFKADLVLVLDEINRGDIPNIFGELLYALEYRDEAVATPYAVDGEGALTVPKALQLLGTMNTADRSIAVIDYALRRRFVFLDVAATDTPIQTYPFDDVDTQAAALHLYSQTRIALAGASGGLQVGPSYFLADAEGGDSSLAVLASRYVYEVLALLGEYEMEGEVDAGAIAALRAGLGLTDGASQHDHAEALFDHLTTKPWIVPPQTPTSTSP